MDKIHAVKPTYIRKSDFIKSFYLPKFYWFWDEQIIEDELSHLIKIEYKKLAGQEVELEAEDEQEQEFECESLDAFKLMLENNVIDFDPTKPAPKFDSPQLIEGAYIAKKFVGALVEKYPNIKVVNLKEILDTAENKSELIYKYYLSKKEDVILLYPTFISQGCSAMADAIVKIGDDLTLIDAYASKKLKAVQCLNLIYQTKIINSYLKEHSLKPIAETLLCLAKPGRYKKMEIPFWFVDAIVPNKTGYDKFILKLGDNNYQLSPKLTSFKHLSDIENGIAEPGKYAKLFNVYLDKNFWSRIKELKEYQPVQEFNWTISDGYLSDFKQANFLKSLKQYWCYSNLYNFVGYCGSLLNFDVSFALQKEHRFTDFPKTKDPKENMQYVVKYWDSFECTKKDDGSVKNIKKSLVSYANKASLADDKKKYYIPNLAKHKFKKVLKPKKVYFDFETINLAIRPMDNANLYQQIVTQVSVIIDHNDGTPVNQLKCNNIVIDPKNVTLDDFKKIVDALLDGVDNPNEYSFIVYNQSFERSRLKEMAQMLDETYYNKIKSIIGGYIIPDEDLDDLVERRIEKEKMLGNSLTKEAAKKLIKNECGQCNLLDLADFFDANKCEESVAIWQLKGFYSIKYVLNYIMVNDRHIFDQTGCRNYKELDVQNGAMAQRDTTLRFFQGLDGIDYYDDAKWAIKEQQLKVYCENDVRAMIALEYWLKEKCNE